MDRIKVLVVETRDHVQNEGIAAELACDPALEVLAFHRGVVEADIGPLLATLPALSRSLLAVVTQADPVADATLNAWLAARPAMVVAVFGTDKTIRLAVDERGFEALRAYVEESGVSGFDFDGRLVRLKVLPTKDFRPSLEWLRDFVAPRREDEGESPATANIHRLPRIAGTNVRQAAASAAAPEAAPERVTPRPQCLAKIVSWARGLASAAAGDGAPEAGAAPASFEDAFPGDVDNDSLGLAAHRMAMRDDDKRLLAFALAAEIEPRIQESLIQRFNLRLGTLGLYCALLGDSVGRRLAIEDSGALATWRVFADSRGGLPSAEEAARLDPALVGFLLGRADSLEEDVRVRRMTRRHAWPGAGLVSRPEELSGVRDLLSGQPPAGWILFCDPEPSGWRALIEAATAPLRIEAARLSGLDLVEIEESGIRLGRASVLLDRPCVVDLFVSHGDAGEDEGMRVLLAAIGSTGCRAAIVCPDGAKAARLLGDAQVALVEDYEAVGDVRRVAARAAVLRAGASLREGVIEALANRQGLDVEGLALAGRLASGRAQAQEKPRQRCVRLVSAASEVATEGLSGFAERITPTFRLSQVVLPDECKSQLFEIIANVRHASRVLDEWKFGTTLPYGRGVGAMLHGPSGTGKTMAAFAIARELRKPILRFDASKILSRWLGDSQKAMERIFRDAERTGCAILVDEADAFLHRRSDGSRGSSSHEKYSDMELSYLLTRLEAFSGLVLLTTNLRQNVDPGFVRRLRFIVEFPRPDAQARATIWKKCLPADSHALRREDFEMLGRRVELTGGHIRQISLRAAFIAAGRGAERITIDDVDEAVRAEYLKLGLPAVAVVPARKQQAA